MNIAQRSVARPHRGAAHRHSAARPSPGSPGSIMLQRSTQQLNDRRHCNSSGSLRGPTWSDGRRPCRPGISIRCWLLTSKSISQPPTSTAGSRGGSTAQLDPPSPAFADALAIRPRLLDGQAIGSREASVLQRRGPHTATANRQSTHGLLAALNRIRGEAPAPLGDWFRHGARAQIAQLSLMTCAAAAIYRLFPPPVSQVTTVWSSQCASLRYAVIRGQYLPRGHRTVSARRPCVRPLRDRLRPRARFCVLSNRVSPSVRLAHATKDMEAPRQYSINSASKSPELGTSAVWAS